MKERSKRLWQFGNYRLPASLASGWP